MFNKEDPYLTQKREAAIVSLGSHYLADAANFVQRQTPPPVTAERLVEYHNSKERVLQGGLRAFWRTLVSVPHVGQEFERALAILAKEKNHA